MFYQILYFSWVIIPNFSKLFFFLVYFKIMQLKNVQTKAESVNTMLPSSHDHIKVKTKLQKNHY